MKQEYRTLDNWLYDFRIKLFKKIKEKIIKRKGVEKNGNGKKKENNF